MTNGLRLAAWTTLGIVATYLLAVWTTTGQYVDNLAMAVLSTSARDVAWAETVLGVISPFTVLVGAVTITGLAWLSRGPLVGLAAAGTLAGTIVISQVLKEVLTRPTLQDQVASNSLPSGHVAAVAALAVAVAVAVPRSLRGIAAALGVVAVGVTGAATVVLEWHRPSDVVAAGLIAIAMGGVSTAYVVPLASHAPTDGTDSHLSHAR